MYDAAEPRGHSNLSADASWAALSAELDLWAAAGRTATFWWRDDDAGKMTDPLQRLLLLRDMVGVDLALATVPTRVDDTFRARMAEISNVAVLQHGYSHHNFATPDERRPECSRRLWRRHRDQPCEFAEVLGCGCEVELVTGAVRST